MNNEKDRARNSPAPFPYLAIAREIQAAIARGELSPGERAPSTREITRRWGVAMATASKVLATLRREGAIETKAGVGSVVVLPAAGVGTSTATSPPRPEPRPARPAGGDDDDDEHARSRSRAAEEPLSRQRIAAAGVAVADHEGLGAVSMRRVASELEVAPMSLYRHVTNKDDLVVAMLDALFARFPPPGERPGGWRAQLEAQARLHWGAYREHPWVAQALSFTRPQATPNTLPHTEWALAALSGMGLSPSTMMYVAVTVFNYVRGMAINLVFEAEAQFESGVSSEEFMASQEDMLQALAATGRFPVFSEIVKDPDLDVDLDVLFEVGLGLLLDGLGQLLGGRAQPRRAVTPGAAP